ncbi:hypothetical protein BC827DRAFT_1218481 [Russula dissimulans]|nr:hypothetical protein BC827DRAFT_1218481 [Russula dissimulans]
MVKYPDFAAALQDFAVLKNFWHATHGIYIWEFFIALDYDFDILQGRRPYRWTIWIYSLTRMTTLLAIILNLIEFNSTTEINCPVWLTFELIFSYSGVAAASLLIVLRIIAIWNKDKVIVAISTGIWVVNVSVIIQGIARLRASWDPSLKICTVLNTERNKLNIIVTLITDIVLLLIMLVGLLHLRQDGGGRFGIGLLLWNQGVLWLFLATIAEVPPMVFIILNLNEPLNLMFQFPAMITLSIAATRMYRALSDFASRSTDITIGTLPIRGNKGPKMTRKHNSSVPIQPRRIEVAVDTAYERSPGSNEPLRSMDEQLGNKPQGLSRDNDLERGPSWRPGSGRGTRDLF